MRCYEAAGCSEQKRSECFLYSAFQDKREEMENLPCFIIKGRSQEKEQKKSCGCGKCCYFKAINRDGLELKNGANSSLVIVCRGVLNDTKADAFTTIIQRFERIEPSNVVLDFTSVTNIYSSCIGKIVRLHLLCQKKGGKLIVAGAGQHLQVLMESLKLDRIFVLTTGVESAEQYLLALQKKKEAAREKRDVSGRKLCNKGTQRCWEYFKGHNPRNATSCDECAVKSSDLKKPCWIIEKVSEGVAIEYVNEECCCCKYYEESAERKDSQ